MIRRPSRRMFIGGVAALAGGSAILFALVALGAEPARSARIGILSTLSIKLTSPGTANFIAELQRLGYVEGRNLTIDFRSAEDKPARLPDLAQELVRLKPDVILTIGTVQSTVAALKATATIPIVFVHAGDPVRTGLVASLGRPGGNVTGVTSLNADLGAKRLALIFEIVSGVRRVAVIVDPQAAWWIGLFGGPSRPSCPSSNRRNSSSPSI